MKLIGVTGKSFSGKTTLSDLLGNYSGVSVIHLDDLMEPIKNIRLFKKILYQKKDSPKRLNTNIVRMINKSKILFKLYMFIKKILLLFKLKRTIKKFEKAGKDAVVIESIFLDEIIKWDSLDYRILVTRDENLRRKGAIQREKCEAQEFDNIDLPYNNGIYSLDKLEFDEIIENNSSVEELQGKVDAIIKKVLGIQRNQNQDFIPKVKIRFSSLKDKSKKPIGLRDKKIKREGR